MRTDSGTYFFGGGGGTLTLGASVWPGKDLTRAIEVIANSSEQPLQKAVLKEKLRQQGFPDDRLSNYFYTAIMRLKKTGRIRVMDDGRVWRPEKKETPAMTG